MSKPILAEQSPVAIAYRAISDQELVGQFVDKHDGRAFSEIYRRYAVKLARYAYATVGDSHLAEDVVQETFFRIFRNARWFKRDKKFSSWAYKIASNLAKNTLRNRKKKSLVLLGDLMADPESDTWQVIESADGKMGPERDFEARERLRRIEATIRQLNPHFREVLVMREFDGLSYREIANAAQIDIGTVKSRLNRARAAFAELYGPLTE